MAKNFIDAFALNIGFNVLVRFNLRFCPNSLSKVDGILFDSVSPLPVGIKDIYL